MAGSQPASTSSRSGPCSVPPGPAASLSKDFDLVGEAITGWFARRKARKLDWSRAHRIVDAAKNSRPTAKPRTTTKCAAVPASSSSTRPRRHRPPSASPTKPSAAKLASLYLEQFWAIALANGHRAELATGEGKTHRDFPPHSMAGWAEACRHHRQRLPRPPRRRNHIPRVPPPGPFVGVIQDSTTPDGRRKAYAADITYAADSRSSLITSATASPRHSSPPHRPAPRRPGCSRWPSTLGWQGRPARPPRRHH